MLLLFVLNSGVFADEPLDERLSVLNISFLRLSQVYCVRTGMWQEIQALSHPEDAWGPAEECNRSGRYICHDDDDVDEDVEKEGKCLENSTAFVPKPAQEDLSTCVRLIFISHSSYFQKTKLAGTSSRRLDTPCPFSRLRQRKDDLWTLSLSARRKRIKTKFIVKTLPYPASRPCPPFTPRRG